MKKFILPLLCLLSVWLPLRAAEPVRAALFVADRIADPLFEKKAGAFTDMLAAQLAQNNIAVADQRDTVKALQNYASPKAAGAGMAKLDAALEDETTALALARAMGVDCIIVASLTGYDTQSRQFNGYGVLTLNQTHMLHASARLLDTRDGAALAGVNAVATLTTPERTSLKVEESNVAVPLMAEAAQKLATALASQIKDRASTIAQAGKVPAEAAVQVRTVWGDLLFPEVIKTKEGEYRTTQTRYPVDISGVSVALDGIVVGTTPTTISHARGLAKLKLTREGFAPWERMVNVTEGLNLTVALSLDEQGLARWKDMAQFLEDLKQGSKLTDAEVRQIDGYAQMLRQSGYMIRQSEDIKVDTKEGIIQNYNQSLLQQTPAIR